MDNNIIPEELVGEYDFIERIDHISCLIKHNTCGIEGKYYPHYFKEKIPCRECRKASPEVNFEKMKKHFTWKLIDFELIDVETVVHRKCGRTITLPEHWKARNNKNLCLDCKAEEKKQKKIEFLQFALENQFPDFELIDSEHILHKICSKKMKAPINLKSKTNETLCSHCANEIRRQAVQERNAIRVKTVTNGEYEMIGELEAYSKPVLIKHMGDCQYEFRAALNDFLNKNTRCPLCAKVVVPKENYIERLQEGFTMVSDYKGMKKEVTIRHEVCGKEETKLACDILAVKNPCSYCNNHIKDMALMQEKIHSIVGDEYTLLTFEATSKDAWFIHNTCQTKYVKRPCDFLQGIRCPECSGSGSPRLNPDTIITGGLAETRQEKFERKFGEKFPNYTIIHNKLVCHNVCGEEIPFYWKQDRYKKDHTLCPTCKKR